MRNKVMQSYYQETDVSVGALGLIYKACLT